MDAKAGEESGKFPSSDTTSGVWGFHGYDYVAGQGPTALGGKSETGR